MSLADWLGVGAVGVVLWGWFFKQVFSRDGYFDKRPRWCTGCQRHFVRPGCPVHDPQRRRA